MFLQELTWQQFSNLSHIKKMPLNEQERQFRIYLYEVNMDRIAYVQSQAAAAAVRGLGPDGPDDHPRPAQAVGADVRLSHPASSSRRGITPDRYPRRRLAP